MSPPLPVKIPSDRPGRLTDQKSIGTLLRDVVLGLVGWFGAFEYHENVLLASTGVRVTHGLKRVPWGLILCACDLADTVRYDPERSSETEAFVSSGTKAPTVRFVLF